VRTGFRWGGLREGGHFEDRRRWEDNIKMYIQEVGWRCMDWTDLVQDKDGWPAVVDAVTNLRIPSATGKFFAS